MVALEFLDFLTKFQITNYVGIEDFADKFHFHFTVIILLLSTLVITVKQYVLKPISCYMATDIGGKNLLIYLENYCWVQGTIPIAYGGKIPSTAEELRLLEDMQILYYQWVPFALGIQCIMFYVPRLIWQIICYNHTGTDLQHIVASANQAVHSSEEAKTKMVSYLAKSIAQTCYQHREYRKGPVPDIHRKIFQFCRFFVVSKRMGTRISSFYIMIKLLYLINGFVQLYLMQKFLGFSNQNSSFFGLEIVKSIYSGKDWQDSLVFPRVGFCFVLLNHLGSVNTVAAQCVLPVNMLNERLYIFLWCWIFIGVNLTIISIIIWMVRLFHSLKGSVFTKKFLLLKEIITNNEKYDKELKIFERKFLRQDGLFLLKMISINAGDLITADVVVNLWLIFQSNAFPVKHFESNDNANVETSLLCNSRMIINRFVEFHRHLIKFNRR